jgi:hypothetical protein
MLCNELGDNGIKRTGRMIGRKEVLQSRVWLSRNLLREGGDRRDLSMPGSPESSTACPRPSFACRIILVRSEAHHHAIAQILND